MDEKALNELLECSVCLEQLDHTSKVLPCQHTFCRRCLEEIVSTKDELRCPECRFLVECRVDELPSNILLIRLLEGLKTQSRFGGTPTGENRNSRSPGHTNSTVQTAAIARQQQLRQNNGKSRPCAKAIFNYKGEDGDLTLKKGDLVYLRKQVDDNWYQGELNGQHGFFPANFVQVITPLPTAIPQCKALYDFGLDNDKEGDCLTLKKDEIVTVIRKVDDNWIEGRRGDKIGIFPISFGEMNEPAKILLRLSGNTHTSQNKEPPATPAQPTKPLRESSPPRTQSPNLAQGDTPIVLPQGVQPAKRHSLTNISTSQTTNNNLPQRRSLDISPELQAMAMGIGEQTSAAAALAPDIVPLLPAKTSSSGSGLSRLDQPHVETSPSKTAESAKSTRVIGATSAKQPPPQPVEEVPLSVPAYMALYNYKPQKQDELELHKGDYYTVSEKCQDGWYKGQCIKTGTAGVFPGNYVQPAKSQGSAFKPVNKTSGNRSSKAQSQAMLPAMGSSQNASVPPRPKTSPGRSSSSTDSVRQNSTDTPGRAGSVDKDTPPPPIVPRTGKVASPQQQASGSKAPSSVTTTQKASSSSPSSPVLSASSKTTRYVRASKSISPHVGGKAGSKGEPILGSQGGSNSASSSPIWKHSLSASANITPPNMVVGATGESVPKQGASATNHSSSQVTKKKKKDKDKISLAKILVAAGVSKKSKSSDTDLTSLSDSGVSHSRSDSYPSDMGSSAQAEGGHKKSGSFDSTASGGQSRPSRPKPLVREKYRSTETYPAQSEIELDLKIGDIIYVHKKRDDGWFKGTLQRSGKTGLFPGSFVEKCD